METRWKKLEPSISFMVYELEKIGTQRENKQTPQMKHLMHKSDDGDMELK